MKLLIGNGSMLEVRDVGPVRMRLSRRPGGPPIKFHGRELMEEDTARELLRGILATGEYDNETAR
jgi:hypothetical protein